MNRSTMRKRDKIAGAIYGFAIGDAMGATTEFMTSKQIRKNYGKVTNILGGGWLHLRPGEVTDDTQMTMCVMDAVMKGPQNLEAFIECCEHNFIDWISSKPKDVGAQCARAIHNLMVNNEKMPVNNLALGNGSLMRAMPLAILDMPLWNVKQGEITHNNAKCSDIILQYSRLIHSYIYDEHDDLLDECLDKFLLFPTGHVENTFNNSVYWSNANSFEAAIIGAVNDGGDADTIAAIAGSLAGAKFGCNAIPRKWINRLDPNVKKFLEKFKIFAFSYLQI